VAAIKSVAWPRSNRSSWPRCIGIRKRENLQDIQDYLAKDPTAPTWTTIQDEWRDISNRLQSLMTELSGKDQALVEGAGFEKASDLEAALNQQTRIYKQLPDMAAPKDESERDTLSRVLSKLNCW
jgi:hypothetical protein